MWGLFAFQNFQDLILYEYDDDLFNIIRDNSAELDGVNSSQSTGSIREEYCDTAPQYILQYCAPLLASHLFFAAEFDQGIRQLDGENGEKITLSKVADVVVVFISTDMNEDQVESLLSAFKLAVRMKPSLFLNREVYQMDGETTGFFRELLKTLIVGAVNDPSFVSRTEPEYFLPNSLISDLKLMMEKLYDTPIFRRSLEAVILTFEDAVISQFYRSGEALYHFHDMLLLPVVINSLVKAREIHKPKTISEPADFLGPELDHRLLDGLLESHQKLFDIAESPSLSDICKSSSSVSLSCSQTPDMLTDAGSLSSFYSLSQVDPSLDTLYLRHRTGGVFSHRITVVPITAVCRLTLISRSPTSSLVPYTIDALNLAFDLQEAFSRPGGTTGQDVQRGDLASLVDIMQRILECPERSQLGPAIADRIQGVLTDLRSAEIKGRQIGRTRKTVKNDIDFQRTTLRSLHSAARIFKDILRIYSSSHLLSPEKERLWFATTKKARQLLLPTVLDAGDFLQIKTRNPYVPMKTICVGLDQPPSRLLFVNHLTSKHVVALSSEDEPKRPELGSFFVDVLTLRNLVGGNILTLDGGWKRCFTHHMSRQSSTSAGDQRKGTLPDFELYSWYATDVPDRVILKQQENIAKECIKLNSHTAQPVGQCSAFLSRLRLL